MKFFKRAWEAYKTRRELKKCTECGKPFSRLEWGGRQHITSMGGISIHPIDFIVTMKAKTFKEKRELIRKQEDTDRLVRKFRLERGDKFCRNHYKGCPE